MIAPSLMSSALPAPTLMRRFGAMLYDGMLLFAVLFIATAVLLPFRHGQAFRAGQWAYNLYLLGVSFAFFGWFWTHGGQTLGMQAWRLKVCGESGERITWTRAAIRFVTALLSLGLFGLGFFWSWFDKERCCWHDRLSRTRLRIVEERTRGSDRAIHAEHINHRLS